MKLKTKLVALLSMSILALTTGAFAQEKVLEANYSVPKEFKNTRTKAGVREAMNQLIDRATKFDVNALDTIYHEDFHTTLIMPDDTVITYDKKEFITHFRKQAEEGKTQLNTWAKWHDFHVLGDSAVSVLTRKHSGMNGEEMLLLCNIELRFEDGRWQVLREQIFLRPLS
ncbi:nuclear transport factor 2 family protein [Vibrio alginolyticus]|nr:nuclear transport factor 2 family protein [Vibrio alginolyticus]EJR0949513.1 nuclear transport factor 2 family protein [Vibrio alginolyticus]ELB1498798.1 nuclear transport factor 2 family protein [Vibrio alginolyticus]ELB2867875.1 nuclear transport factor 2 family protein [Vibrio alginolyticus]EMD1211371.1 nuclear transport factor 2 family protein [Vibrio alginolyticus]